MIQGNKSKDINFTMQGWFPIKLILSVKPLRKREGE